MATHAQIAAYLAARAAVPDPNWLGAYVECNGAISATAVAGMTPIDDGSVPLVVITWYSRRAATWVTARPWQLSAGGIYGLAIVESGGNIQSYFLDDAGAFRTSPASSPGIPDDDELCVLLSVCRADGVVTQRHVAASDVAVTTATAAVHAPIAAPRTYMSTAIQAISGTSRMVGRWYGMGILAAEPTDAALLASAKGAPPSTLGVGISRLFDPYEAYEGDASGVPSPGGGNYWIPDVAASRYAGPHSAIPAKMAGGNLSAVVYP